MTGARNHPGGKMETSPENQERLLRVAKSAGRKLEM